MTSRSFLKTYLDIMLKKYADGIERGNHMGFLDIFKKKKTASSANTGASPLFSVIEKLKVTQNAEVLQELSSVLKSYVDQDREISIQGKKDKKGIQLTTIKSEGNAYTAMYSADTEIKSSTCITKIDFNDFLFKTFDDTNIAGIVIDPDTTGLFLDKGLLVKCILHGHLPVQDNTGSPQKDWGVGIPAYSKDDLMTETEMLNFAMDAFLNSEKMISTFTPISACDHPDAVASLIFEDYGRFVFVVVKGYCAEEKPQLSAEEKDELQRYCKLFNGRCYYAPVGFGSVDEERCSVRLALKGDGFYAKYEGLEVLQV